MTNVVLLPPLANVAQQPPYERFCELRQQMIRAYRIWLATRPTAVEAEREACATQSVMQQLLDLEICEAIGFGSDA